MWIFVTPQTAAVLLPVDAVVTGIVWSAINLCIFTMMMGMIRGQSVESYVAVQAFLNGIGALGGSLLGGFVASYLKGKNITIFGIDFYGIQVIFLIGSFFRFTAFLLLRRVQTTKIKTVPQVFFNVMSTLGRRMATRPYEFPMLQLKPKRRRPEDEPLKLDLPASMEDISDIEQIISEEPEDSGDQEKRSDS
jgi:MFS family permease